jgi:hypothetical protein
MEPLKLTFAFRMGTAPSPAATKAGGAWAYPFATPILSLLWAEVPWVF